MTTFDKIRQWADDRGLIENSTPKAQMTKLWEEYDELQSAIRAMDLEEIKDAIGDCMVVLTIISAQMGDDYFAPEVGPEPLSVQIEILSGEILCGECDWRTRSSIQRTYSSLNVTASLFGLTIEDCIDHAYDQIKDRKGHMNEAGVFVKEEA